LIFLWGADEFALQQEADFVLDFQLHRSMGDDHGLKWINIDFENRRGRLSGKGKEKYIPMYPQLVEKLQARRTEPGRNDFVLFMIQKTSLIITP